jgi:hypothetical protein
LPILRSRIFSKEPGRLFKKSHKAFCDQSGSVYGFRVFRLSEDVFERSELSEC